jgi:hypothetical protein
MTIVILFLSKLSDERRIEIVRMIFIFSKKKQASKQATTTTKYARENMHDLEVHVE